MRAGITNALDALNYLGGHAKRNSKKLQEPKPVEKPVKEEKPSEVVDEVEEEEIDEEEFEALMKNRGRK